MKSVQTLIAQARELVHTDRELAARLGIKPPDLTEMKKGRRAVSPETVVALCDMLELSGEQTREWVAIAIIENPKNATKADMLRRALFACWALGVAALLHGPSDAEARTATAATNAQCERVTVYTLSRMLWRTLRCWLEAVARCCLPISSTALRH